MLTAIFFCGAFMNQMITEKSKGIFFDKLNQTTGFALMLSLRQTKRFWPENGVV